MRLVLSTVGSLVDEVIFGFVLVKLTISLYKKQGEHIFFGVKYHKER